MIRKFSTTLAVITLSQGAFASSTSNLVDTYSNIALAGYSDSLATAKDLQTAIDVFVSSPTAETLTLARNAWLAARVPYQQTEAFRFANPLVDEWEGKVNAWPLDEGLIDYVDDEYLSAENPLGAVNVIASKELHVSAERLDLTQLTPATLNSLHEVGGIETNVAAGYHAIEFLLWGQDLNGLNAGAGNRSYTDYLVGDGCTHGNCDRRADYLQSAAQLLVSDLQDAVDLWSETGSARADIQADESPLSRIIFGLGSLSYGELAGERMKLGLLVNDPEEEHDCFSDNTHNSHFYDVLGMHNVYYGQYNGLEGRIEGPSIADWVQEVDPTVAASVDRKFAQALNQFVSLKAAAEAGEAYDTMLAQGNSVGNARVQAAIDSLVALAGEFEKLAKVLGLETQTFEGSDSLDNPDAVI